MSLKNITEAIKKLPNAGRAQAMNRFFKSGPGEYGEKDVFAGISNPECREIAK